MMSMAQLMTLEKGFHTCDEAGDTTFRNSDQSWYFHQIREVKDRHGNKSKIRVMIRRAAYSDYSEAAVQVWSPSNGWLTFHTQGVESLPVQEVSYVMDYEQVVKPFTDSAEHLWLIAGEHFGR